MGNKLNKLMRSGISGSVKLGIHDPEKCLLCKFAEKSPKKMGEFNVETHIKNLEFEMWKHKKGESHV